MSRLDFGNAMFYGLPETQLRKLQMIQNSAARLITGNPQTRSHNTSFIQFTLVAYSSANRVQTSFTCVSRCASSMPCVSVVASDSIHTHPNTEIRRSTSIDLYRGTISSGTVVGPFLWQGRHCGTPCLPQLGTPTPLRYSSHF